MRWLLLLLISSAAAQPMIVAVAPDLPGDQPDEAVGLWSETDWILDGYALSDGEDTQWLTGVLPAGELVWFVANPPQWERVGMPPGRELTLRLGNQGDQIALRGNHEDAFAWGDKTTPGMSGSIRTTGEGLIYARTDGHGRPVAPLAGGVAAPRDTNDASDWMTSRTHVVGESNWPQPTFWVQKLTLYSSPDASHAVLLDAVAGATERLHLHVYLLSHPTLAPALAAAAERGVDVRVLVDGNPVGQDADERHRAAWSLQQIQAAGGEVMLAGNDRYRFHHLKALVADDTVAVQSENWVETGVPIDPSTGNRGWGVMLHDAELADWMAEVLASDFGAWDTEPFELANFDPTYQTPYWAAPRSGGYVPQPAQTLIGNYSVTPILSPEHTLHDTRVAWVQNATQRAWLQELDLQLEFSSRSGWSGANPMLDALSNLPPSVDVRVMAAAPFHYDDTGNQEAMAWLEAARPGTLTRTAERDGIGTFHNKAIILDDGVILGSQNGNQNSRAQNREMGVYIAGAEVADFYAQLYIADWENAPVQDWSTIGDDVRSIPAGLPMLMVALYLVARRGT